jgi:hypothetical protein
MIACESIVAGRLGARPERKTPMTPEEVITKQLEAYNAHDLEAFCSWYAEDVQLSNLHEAEPYMRSKDALKEVYRQKFANKNLKARISDRLAKGRFVIDREKVAGVGEGELDVIVVYEVADDLIRKVSFIR